MRLVGANTCVAKVARVAERPLGIWMKQGSVFMQQSKKDETNKSWMFRVNVQGKIFAVAARLLKYNNLLTTLLTIFKSLPLTEAYR